MMRTARILVVADDASARSAVIQSHRALGYEVEAAEDVASAIQQRAAFSPHVVVLDFELRGISGVDLIARLRDSDPPAIVVMLAAGASPVQALRAGAQGCVHKPLDLEELRIVLERVVANDQLARENRDLNARLAQLMSTGMPPIPGSRLDELERYAILETLKVTAGSTSKAAEMLGISVRTIQYRLHDYNATPRSQLAATGSGKTVQR